jgi:hypothetical protein
VAVETAERCVSVERWACLTKPSAVSWSRRALAVSASMENERRRDAAVTSMPGWDLRRRRRDDMELAGSLAREGGVVGVVMMMESP